MMSYLEKLEFSKDWTDAEDFPTYEPDESQVRADLQLLHNEAKAAINALVDKLESAEFASHLAVSAEGMTATNLAAALAEILATANSAQAGTIVDGTVTEAKLAAALVQKIRMELAREHIAAYLQGMATLGFTEQEARALLKEE